MNDYIQTVQMQSWILKNYQSFYVDIDMIIIILNFN